MDNILKEFTNEMESLVDYIEYHTEAYELVNTSKSSTSQQNGKLSFAKLKKYNFNAYIISLYGEFEHFIEQIKIEYLSKICLIIKNFKNLPKPIQEINLQKTLDILKNPNYKKFSNINIKEVVKILHNNMNEDHSNLNQDVFKNHTANFRISTICQYFSEVGINDFKKRIIKYDPLKNTVTISNDNLQKISDNFFYKIDHICDIRNDIAHGNRNIELLHSSILIDYIKFFKYFSETLYALLYDNYLSILFEYNGSELEPIEVYRNKILACNTKNNIIDKKCKLLVKRNNEEFPKYFILDIINIEHNRISLNSTEKYKNIDIGIEVRSRINKKMKFKLIKEFKD